MTKLSILLLYGGESPEHDVSMMSARNIYAAIDGDKYDVTLCYIDQVGKWWLTPTVNGDHQNSAQLVPVMGQQQFVTIPGGRTIHPDVLWPALHGNRGEDGTIQGLAELMHLPIIGCDFVASAVCWDKVITKQVLESSGIQTSPYLLSFRGQAAISFDDVAARFSAPFFVKPARAGSSIGVSKVHDEAEYHEALAEAFRYSGTILIEKAIEGRELEVAVLGNPPDHRASGVGEIKPGEEFYSYEDKYNAASSAEVMPHAEISDELRETIRSVALKAYQLLGCRGLARVDFLLSSSNELYINEINTLPGFTNISQYPKLWHEEGIKYPALVDRLVSLALEK